MQADDRTWLENRLHAAVDDDFYLDRDEEKRIKEEAASRGIAIREIEAVVQTELKKSASVSERLLLEEFDRLLHQFTADDKLLDRKEERDAFDRVVLPAAGKRKGLDARVAEDYVVSFCKVNGVKRSTSGGVSPLAWGVGALALAVLLIAAVLLFRGGEPAGGAGAPRSLTVADREAIDGHLRQAEQYIERAQYTEPPERSAKAELDEIAQIDPTASYRSEQVNGLKRRIVAHYLALASRSAGQDRDGARRWLDRARLLKADTESIDARARSLGLE